MSWRSAVGSTLFEMVIVIATSTLVMLGIVSFYLNSQATWLDGSVQAIAQREAGVIVRTLTDSLRLAASAVVYDSPDSLRQGIVLRNQGGAELFRMWWNAGDSLVHMSARGGSDFGPIGRSTVERLQFGRCDSLVELRLLRLRSSQGDRVQVSTTVNMYNR